MATYQHTADLLGQRPREFWWTEKFAVKGKIVEAPSDWLDQHLNDLASANVDWRIVPWSAIHPKYKFPTGEMKIPEWDHSLAVGKYIWFDSSEIAPPPDWMKGCDHGMAHWLHIPDGVTVEVAGIKHASGVYVEQSD